MLGFEAPHCLTSQKRLLAQWTTLRPLSVPVLSNPSPYFQMPVESFQLVSFWPGHLVKWSHLDTERQIPHVCDCVWQL